MKKSLEGAETHLALPKPTEDVENIEFEGIGDENVDHVDSAEKSESHRKAAKITDKAIEMYWRRLESERTAKRVHQEDVLTGEKILRFFDVSSQYGVRCGTRPWFRGRNLADLNVSSLVSAVHDCGDGSELRDSACVLPSRCWQCC